MIVSPLLLLLLWSQNCCFNDIGEVVGALSFSVGQDANMLRKLASAKVLHHGHNIQNTVSYPLKRTVSFLFWYYLHMFCDISRIHVSGVMSIFFFFNYFEGSTKQP